MIRKSDFKCLAGIIAGIFTMASAVCAADEATLGGQTLQPVMVGDDDGMYLRYQIDGSGKAPFVCDGDITCRRLIRLQAGEPARKTPTGRSSGFQQTRSG